MAEKRKTTKTTKKWDPDAPPNSRYLGDDRLEHYRACGHSDTGPHMSHATGIAAHIAIYLKPCVDIWQAYRAILAVQVHGIHVEKVHVSLGEIDLLADVHAPWTTPPGRETRIIGDWVNAVRTLAPTGEQVGKCECCFVARTSTNVCMMPDS